REYGIAVAEPEEIVGGDAAANVAIAERMLDGEPGPVRDVVALNAAAALLVAGAAPDLGAGLDQATAAIESGKAASVLETFMLTRRSARAADGAGGMSKAIQCPSCGRKHRVATLPDAPTFKCENCGQPLKVPAQFRPSVMESSRHVRQPDPPRADATSVLPEQAAAAAFPAESAAAPAPRARSSRPP